MRNNSKRVNRGGSWWNGGYFTRAACRNVNVTSTHYFNLGLRLGRKST